MMTVTAGLPSHHMFQHDTTEHCSCIWKTSLQMLYIKDKISMVKTRDSGLFLYLREREIAARFLTFCHKMSLIH